MIIRKPYAFLIKYFKIIHILMFLISGYFIFALTDVKEFLSESALSGSVAKLTDESFFGILYFLFSIVLLGASIAILFLMKKKKKPFIFYISTSAYSFLLILMAILVSSFISGAAKQSVVDASSIAIYRDFAVVMYYASFVIVGISFIRGFGFDIKKFSFDKDKEELDLSQEDSAEVVLDINIDKDKIINKARKYKREWGYIYKDNEVLLKRIGIGIVAAIAIYLIATSNLFDKTYDMQEFIDAGRFGIRIDKVLLSNKDAYGEVRDKNYVAVQFTIKTGSDGTYFDNRFLRVKINGEYYYSTNSVNSIMGDIGKVYNNEKLAGGKTYTYVLLFDYDRNINASNVGLEVMLDEKYYKINIMYVAQDKKGYKEKDYKLGEKFDALGGMTINSFAIHGGTTEYRYTPKDCQENCKEYTKRIQPKLNEKILELNLIYQDTDENNKLLDCYVSLEYEVNGKIYTNKAKQMTLLDHASLSDGQRLYYSINPNVSTAKNKYLVIRTREAKYRVLLQEENE